MIEFLVGIVLFALSLCADSFAVSLCSSLTLRRISFGSVARVAIVFALIHTGFFVGGFAFGHLLVGLVEKVARIIGFVLLLYVGVSMIVEGFRIEKEVRELNTFGNLLLGGIATSIDALAVGVSLCLAAQSVETIVSQAVAIFICTILSVVLGIIGGKKIGEKAGIWATTIGGLVLIAIGVGLFF